MMSLSVSVLFPILPFILSCLILRSRRSLGSTALATREPCQEAAVVGFRTQGAHRHPFDTWMWDEETAAVIHPIYRLFRFLFRSLPCPGSTCPPRPSVTSILCSQVPCLFVRFQTFTQPNSLPPLFSLFFLVPSGSPPCEPSICVVPHLGATRRFLCSRAVWLALAAASAAASAALDLGVA